MGGTNDPSNLVELTVEEHAEAHKILWEVHGKWQDKIAWMALSGRIGKEEIIREIQRNTKLGTKLSNEAKEKMRQAKLGKKRPPRTEAHSKKISELKSKTWTFKNPNGVTITIINLSKFCKDNNLSNGNMKMVHDGQRKQHKGYTI